MLSSNAITVYLQDTQDGLEGSLHQTSECELSMSKIYNQ